MRFRAQIAFSSVLLSALGAQAGKGLGDEPVKADSDGKHTSEETPDREEKEAKAVRAAPKATPDPIGSTRDAWSSSLGFSILGGVVPAADASVSGVSLEYGRRYGKTSVRAEYTYGLLEAPISEDPHGVVHRAEVSWRLPVPSLTDDKAGLFLEPGLGVHQLRWRDGTKNIRPDAALAVGIRVFSAELASAIRIKVLLGGDQNGPDVGFLVSMGLSLPR